MDIERLKELSECGRELYMLNDENLIERIRSDNQLQNYLSDSIDAIDEAIARQSVKSAEIQEAIGFMESQANFCKQSFNGSNKEYTPIYEIAITALQAYQKPTSEEVAEAIERFEKRNNKLKEVQDNGDAGCVDIETWEKYQGFIEDNNLAITALQAYQPKPPKGE